MTTSDSLRLMGCGGQGNLLVSFWDLFFRVRNGRAVEWYSDWTDLQGYLGMLVFKSIKGHTSVKILVAGCGNSELSAHMYDVGWLNITNVDFSRVVIAEMLRLHVRCRPHMRWQVMDITDLQVADSCFDVVFDKGSLDSLMADTTVSSLAARSYLSEVKRVLRVDGKYACVTAAHSHVLVDEMQLFIHSKDVYGPPRRSRVHPYLICASKISGQEIAPVKYSFGINQNAVVEAQMQLVVDLIIEENRLRSKGGFSNPADLFSRLHQGRRIPMKLGKHYPAVVLDAKPNAEPPALRCGVFLVPKRQAREWLFSSEEGQWQVVETAQAGRLILVTLDAQQTDSMDVIEQELSPLVKPLLPLDCRDSDTILYMTTNDALTQRTLLEEMESPITGTIHVEEVVVLSEDSLVRDEESKPRHYRRLIFRRNPNLIQSEASLIPVNVYSKEIDQTNSRADAVRRHSGSKKKHKAKFSAVSLRTGYEEFKVDFSYLASEYHAGIISGLSLIAHNMDQWISAKEPRSAMIVGLGAGLLPMFVYNHIPVDRIQVVELDGLVGDLAKRHFGFVEDERMQLYISDGIEAVGAIAKRSFNRSSLPRSHVSEDSFSLRTVSSSVSSCTRDVDSEILHLKEVLPTPYEASEFHGISHASGNKDEKLHILIIDADSEDPSTGLSCPPAEFLEETFLRSAREVLVDGGILAINVVSRASSPHLTSMALLQKVFEEVYDLEIEEHVNRVLFALPHHSLSHVETGQTWADVMEASRTCFERLARAFAPWGNGPAVKDYVSRLKRLK